VVPWTLLTYLAGWFEWPFDRPTDYEDDFLQRWRTLLMPVARDHGTTKQGE
jgi:hypothetical protein